MAARDVSVFILYTSTGHILLQHRVAARSFGSSLSPSGPARREDPPGVGMLLPPRRLFLPQAIRLGLVQSIGHHGAVRSANPTRAHKPEHTNTIAAVQPLLRQLTGFQLSAETVERLSKPSPSQRHASDPLNMNSKSQLCPFDSMRCRDSVRHG